MSLAIVCAMEQELSALVAVIAFTGRSRLGGREFLVGEMEGHQVVLVRSGIGKAAAAATVALLLSRFEISAVLLAGVAGSLRDDVQIGDLVIARELLQHDMDASPLCPRFEVPHHRRSRFPTDNRLSDDLCAAAERWAQDAGSHLGAARLASFGIVRPRVRQGLVVSGDRFVSTTVESDALRCALPDALAVDMEGAAMAQICAEFDVPFAMLRIISDRADDSADGDFTRFVAEVASDCTMHLALAWLRARAG